MPPFQHSVEHGTVDSVYFHLEAQALVGDIRAQYGRLFGVQRLSAIWRAPRILSRRLPAAQCAGVFVPPGLPSCLRVIMGCEVCSGHLCLTTENLDWCGDYVESTNNDFEDSICGEPSPESEDELGFVVSSTGGSEEVCETSKKSHLLFSSLKSLWTVPPGSLHCLGERLWARSKYLDQLSRCYVFDDQEESYRQFGSTQKDWARLAKYMHWDCVGIVVVNLNRQKCMIYRSGHTPEFGDCTSCVHWLRSFPSALGIMQRSSGDNAVEFAQFDVWYDPSEMLRPRTKTIEKIMNLVTKRIVDKFHNVSFWRP